jgi:hypothetical protein
MVDEIESGFPHLPSACAIVMERQARDIILKSVRQAYQRPEDRIRDAFSEWNGKDEPTFSEFIERTQEDPFELLRRRSWSAWKALVERTDPPEDPDLDSCKLNLSQARVAMQRAPLYLDWLERLATADSTEMERLSRDPLAILAYQLLWNRSAERLGVTTLDGAFQRLCLNQTFLADLQEIVEWSKMRANSIGPQLHGIPSTLELHGLYSGSEINAAFGKATLAGGGSRGTGVIPIHDQKAIVHLVTFEKNKRQFSESTMYRDFPTRPDLLHWESQCVATQDGKIGRIYSTHQSQGYRILFFSRIRKELAPGLTAPFLFLGCGNFIDAIGNRPISIRWQLDYPMPLSHYREARVACGLES